MNEEKEPTGDAQPAYQYYGDSDGGCSEIANPLLTNTSCQESPVTNPYGGLYADPQSYYYQSSIHNKPKYCGEPKYYSKMCEGSNKVAYKSAIESHDHNDDPVDEYHEIKIAEKYLELIGRMELTLNDVRSTCYDVSLKLEQFGDRISELENKINSSPLNHE